MEQMTQINPVTRLKVHDGVALLEIDSPPVNALGLRVREGLVSGLRMALEDAAVQAIVLACGGRTFFAGADITEFAKPLQRPLLPEIFSLMEGAAKPLVAAIHGTALGGGLELALACHARVATRSSKVGLPEVSLGLLPGAGGTQRAPRLMGVSAALEFIALGQRLRAEAAADRGLIDEVVSDDTDLRAAARRYGVRLAEQPSPLPRARDLTPDIGGEEARAVAAAFIERNPRLFKGYKAPAAIVEAVVAAASLPFEEGIAREAELFKPLMDSREAAAQIHLFFAERACANIPAGDARPLAIGSVGVVGAGTMGSGIATAFLTSGFEVKIFDTKAEASARAARTIAEAIESVARKGRTTGATAAAQLAALSTTGELRDLADCDLIIEAVFEEMELKRSVFAMLDQVAKPGAILASNTSFLDLDLIGSATSRPQHVVGLHFFAPANVMRLLEVVRGARTSDAVLATAMDLGRKLRKVAVLSGVCEGFIANRLMAKRSETADRLILQGPMPRDIDQVLTDFGFPMGPFAMMDLVGLDVVGRDRDATAARTVQDVLRDMGRLGQKQNGGYYDYDDQRRRLPSAEADRVIQDFRAGASARTFSSEELLRALLYPVVNEGAKLLEEGVALRSSDIDIALVTGYGWPAWTGGPMFWGETVGLPHIVAHLKVRQAAGEDVALSPLLEKLADKKRSFADATS